MKLLKKISRGLFASEANAARAKEGCRAYAVGDIHGRLDLLDELLVLIERDNASRGPAKTFVIFLGDLIDRGPDSAGVVERLRTYKPSFARPIFLGGNHEEVLLRILGGDKGVLPSWLKFGGAECAASYGMNPERLKRMTEPEAMAVVRAKIPAEHKRFLESFGDTFSLGDYLFVHAGIRPGLSLSEQDRSDLRWIREPFLTDAKEHGFIVVHGHTIVRDVEERRNRIGIDTGAYKSGILTALGVEGTDRWFLATGGAEKQVEAIPEQRMSAVG